MMAQLGHMDRQTSLDYVHIQQRALERAKQLIEAEQAEILASTDGREREQHSLEIMSERTRSPRVHIALGASPPTLDSRAENSETEQSDRGIGQVHF